MVIDYGIVKDFASISEAYLDCVQEDAEGRNINRAERYISAKHAIMLTQTLSNGERLTPRTVTEIVRNAVPNSRLLKCKFLKGVTRIYLSDIMNSRGAFKKANVLDRILKSISNNSTMRDGYDFDLNGLSLDELRDSIAVRFPKEIDDDRKRINGMAFERRGDYSVVPIRSFAEARPYAKYADWCICDSERMYDSYTADGDGMFYFCLKDGFERIRKEKGDGSPLDEYGLSMVAVCINSDGSLNSCTTRWNHMMGNDGNALDTEGISRLVGRNFYVTFSPRSADDRIAMLRSHRIEDDGASIGLGGFGFDDHGFVKYAVRRGDEVKEYSFVHKTSDGKTCVAGDRLEWFDGNGRRIDPPTEVNGDFRLNDCFSLKTLEGCPSVVKGDFAIVRAPLVKDLCGSPKEVLGDIELIGCDGIETVEPFPNVHGYVNCLACPKIGGAEIGRVAARSPKSAA